MNNFISERKANWRRLEKLLLKIKGLSGLRNLPRAEVREFGDLYRRTASDLAIARVEIRDPELITYLNSLVVRAHGRIYRAESQGMKLMWKFFSKDFPQSFRQNQRFIAIAFGIEIFFAVLAFVIAFNDLSFADVIGIGDVRHMVESKRQWWLSINEANQVASAFLFTHNIRVSIMAFVWGAFLCIGSVYILAINGLYFGGILGVCYKVDPSFGNALLTFVVGHGVIETFCIYISGGAGMMIGYAIINPGDLRRSDALKKKGLEAVRLIVGCACILVIAGLIEGFLSPSGLPAWIKYVTGISTGIAMVLYLFLVGKDKNKETSNPV